MHNLFLGLIKKHFTSILGITSISYQKNAVIPLVLGTLPPSLSESDKKGVKKLKRWLVAPAVATFSSDWVKAVNKLKGANLRSLDFVCTQLQCSLPTKTMNYTKTDFANAFLDWVSFQVFVFLSVLTL